MDKIKKLARLFVTMLKIGLFTFGGGYAMIALLEEEFVTDKGWIDRERFLDMVAIAESTPGPIAINSATYIGYRVAGVWGSLVATVAVCIPSFVIIYVISLFFDAFLSLTYVAYAFQGIRVCVVYLIASAGVKLFKGLDKTPFSIALTLVSFVAMLLLTLFAVDFSSIFFILIGGVLGLAFYGVRRLVGRKGGRV